MRKDKLTIHVVANAALGPSLSGGDRIFIECVRRWAKWGHKVSVYLWEEGLEMCRRNKLKRINFVVWPLGGLSKLGFAVGYLARTIGGCFKVLRMDAKKNRRKIIVYSASDFWPDALPAFLMSRKLKAKWVAAFYLFAPNPFKGFTGEYQLPSVRGLFYFLSQKPIYWLTKKFADLIFVTYDLDRLPFEKDGVPKEKIKVMYGGVDLQVANSVRKESGIHYEGCFVGRFHPQKGLKELIETWFLVCRTKKAAKLALIGTGEKEWEDWLSQEVSKRDLKNNVDFLGFLDGEKKFKILKSARVYLCTNLYDSGGMATIEAMACGLPVVSFDIPAIRSLIPKGTLRVSFRDTQAFSKTVLNLLENNELSAKISQEALEFAQDWDWDKRAKRALDFLEELPITEK